MGVKHGQASCGLLAAWWVGPCECAWLAYGWDAISCAGRCQLLQTMHPRPTPSSCPPACCAGMAAIAGVVGWHVWRVVGHRRWQVGSRLPVKSAACRWVVGSFSQTTASACAIRVELPRVSSQQSLRNHPPAGRGGLYLGPHSNIHLFCRQRAGAAAPERRGLPPAPPVPRCMGGLAVV